MFTVCPMVQCWAVQRISGRTLENVTSKSENPFRLFSRDEILKIRDIRFKDVLLASTQIASDEIQENVFFWKEGFNFYSIYTLSFIGVAMDGSFPIWNGICGNPLGSWGVGVVLWNRGECKKGEIAWQDDIFACHHFFIQKCWCTPPFLNPGYATA